MDMRALKDKLAASGDEPKLKEAWEAVCDTIQEHLTKQRPKPKSFEVHHFCERARLSLLETYLASGDVEAAKRQSLFTVGLW